MSTKDKVVSRNISRKNKSKISAKRFILATVKIFFVLFALVALAATGIAAGIIYAYIRTATPITEKQLDLSSNLSTLIYDSKGNVIAKLTGKENMDRILVFDKDGNIPQYLKDAFVAIEDERFYQHRGIDLKRTLGAVLNFLTPGSKTYGGSTITQQVVKNLTGEKDISFKRKVQEQWRAYQLEKRMEKWQILELYMNLIYLGNGSYGIQAASQKYFDKNVKDLTLAEAASLAGITQNPSYYDPFTEEGRIHNKERQILVLKKMLENKFISQQEYEHAIGQPLKFAINGRSKSKALITRSYFVDQAIDDVLKDFERKGIAKEYARLKIFNGGLRIYTTMDPGIQGAMDSVFKDNNSFPGSRNVKGELPQAGMVIIDPKTGQVLAMYGGRCEKTGDMVLNRATQIERQAGSSFKPIAVYGPAIDTRAITAATAIDDVPVHMLGPNKGRYPENYPVYADGKYIRQYRGLTSIRDAVALSINVVAAKVWANDLTPEVSLSYLKKSGIERDQKNLSLALGGLTKGVSPMQMAAAYVPFDNNGVYYQPITYTKVIDEDGTILLDKTKDPGIKQVRNIVYDEKTAFIMTDMMRDVVGPAGTAPYVKVINAKKQAVPVAGKTGTTNEDYDRWFVGYTPYYVGAVWYGYDSPTTVKVSGNNPAARIWNSVMQKIYVNLDSREFPMPPGLVKKKICIYSGKIATELCYKDPRGNDVRDEYFIKGTEPKDNELCDMHVEVKVCKDHKDLWGRRLAAAPNCPADSVADVVFIQRKEPYAPISPDDPYPSDWQYELSSGEYCNTHGTG